MSSSYSFNFVATTYRNLEDELKRELEALLVDFLPISYMDIKITGVVAGKLTGDPVTASKILWNTAYHEPWRVKRALRFIPIKHNCISTLDEIASVAEKLVQEIPAGSTYKIEAELRKSELKWGDVINAIASKMVNLKVKMKDPDFYIYVQILGRACGISALKEDEVFRALKAKLAGSEFP